MSMDDNQIKELGNNLMGCGCVMFLIPIFGLMLVIGIMFVLSAAGIMK
jgi:hypothetical protein